MPDLLGLSYGGIVLALVTAGTIVPFPEEIILLTLGYLTSAAHLAVVPTVVAAICGVLLGDNIMFAVARHGGPYVERLYAMLSRTKMGRLAEERDEYPGVYVFLARFVIGLRTLGPLIAAQRGMSWWRFFLWDTAAVLVYVPGSIWLGHHFHASIVAFIRDIRLAQHAIFILVICAIVAAIAAFYWGRRVGVRMHS
jgi:membrane protein DedA with SNARE-associated domain